MLRFGLGLGFIITRLILVIASLSQTGNFANTSISLVIAQWYCERELIQHWSENIYLHFMLTLKYKAIGCPFIEMTAWHLLCVKMNSDLWHGFLGANGLLVGWILGWLAEIWVKDAEIKLILLYLSLELPVSTHPSRRRRNPPFGSCKFFGDLCEMKKRGNVAISTSYSSFVDSSPHINEKSVETLVSWTLLPSRAFFVLSEIKIRSEHPSQFCFTSWKGFCLTWDGNKCILRIFFNKGGFSEGPCFLKLRTPHVDQTEVGQFSRRA